MFNIDDVNKEVDCKGSIIDAPENLLWVRISPVGDGTPHVEIENSKAFYVSSERGVELFRKEVQSLDELLFLIFERITFRMACDFELKNRIENQDCRKIIFAKQLELIKKIDLKWETKISEEIDKVLERSPY